MRNRSLSGTHLMAVGVLMAMPPAAGTAEPPVLQIVIVDVEDRLVSSAELTTELRRQLQSSGRSIDVRRSAQRSFVPGRETGVILLGRAPTTRGLSQGVMGAVRRSGSSGAIWVYMDNVALTLGLDPADVSSLRRHGPALGRAVGRVVAHEIVHLLLPDSGHAEDGLMAASLSREELSSGELRFDTQTEGHLVTAALPPPR